MSKMGFVASFIATLITLDLHFFDGATTRQAWADANAMARQVDSLVVRTIHRR